MEYDILKVITLIVAFWGAILLTVNTVTPRLSKLRTELKLRKDDSTGADVVISNSGRARFVEIVFIIGMAGKQESLLRTQRVDILLPTHGQHSFEIEGRELIGVQWARAIAVSEGKRINSAWIEL